MRTRRCQREQSLHNTPDSHVSTVTASGAPTANGPTLELDVVVGNVAAIAMVDTGSQCSIISRSLLHKIGRQLRRLGKPVPTLEPASVHLHGKDGAAGQHELNITAQVTLVVAAGGVSVSTIQPDSTQDCLIGMNVAPTLGLSFLANQGKPLRTRGSQSLTNTSVNLIQTQPVPARSRSFVEAEVDAELGEGVCIVFEPNPHSLADDELGCTSVVQLSIDTGDHAPIKQYPRCTPFVQRAQIAKLVADMERKGVISPSVSSWASPVVLVAKKDGSTRFCIDFRRLNAINQERCVPSAMH